MTKFIRRAILLVSLAAGWSACTRDSFDESRPDASGDAVFNSDGTLAATIRLEIPGMSGAMTRTLDDTPDYGSLVLHALVFEEGEGLKQYATLERKDALVSDGEHGHAELLEFKISLEPTEKKATLHLIATNQPRFGEQIVYGTEEHVVTALYTDDAHEAYWQRIVFGSNIPGKEQTDEANRDHDDPFKRYDPEAAANAAKIRAQLNHVPMVRNFCRVSVDASGAAAKDGFVLTGLYVLNTVDRGSVAPYVTTADHRKFVDGYVAVDDTDGKFRGLSYADISARGHVGSLPAGVQLINRVGGSIVTKSEDLTGATTLAPVYFYERPARVNSTERTYAILRGHRQGEESDSFYKVDLGYIDENFKDEDNHDAVVGRFEYYNLLRNFDFRIHLRSVTEQGYASLEAAAKGTVFNNFSASVEARTMTSISDGEEMIFVKFFNPLKQKDIFFTSYVFTLPGDIIHLKSQYRTGIDLGRGGDVHNELIRVKFDEKEGDPGVIAGIRTVREDSDAAADETGDWNEYEVTGGVPTEKLQQQTVYVYRGLKTTAEGVPEYGLYRVITFFSHLPWSFVHMDTFPGLWNDYDNTPWDWGEEWREIGQLAGSPLTLFFELPAGLPQALFPLEFVIESDRQNIQNAYEGNAVVRSVPADESLFYAEGAAGNPMTSRIQYVKTVTWADYYGEYNEEQIGTGNSVVRCRFRTITDLAQDGIGDPGDDGDDSHSVSQTRLRVANPYFGVLQDDGSWQMYHEDGFTRSTSTSDPSPRFWDFSSPLWNRILDEMGSSAEGGLSGRYDINPEAPDEEDYKIYTESNNNSDELIFVDGTVEITVRRQTGTWMQQPIYGDVKIKKPTLTSGVDEKGLRYVQTAVAGDLLKHKHTYPASQNRTIRLAVMSTDADGNTRAPKITGTIGGNKVVYTTYTVDEESGPYPIYVYDIQIEDTVTKIDLDFSAPDDDPVIRFYKIDFYPRWDEIPTTE